MTHAAEVDEHLLRDGAEEHVIRWGGYEVEGPALGEGREGGWGVREGQEGHEGW